MKYPEMVKTNSRYRGPMESRKQNNTERDIGRSIEILRQQFENRSNETTSLFGGILTQYNETIPDTRRAVVDGVQALRGGEL